MMKKIIKSILLSLSLVIFAASCKAPVFYEIMRDVAPEDATISGYINSITRYNDKLVTYSSAGLISKTTPGSAHGEWTVFQPDLPKVSGEFIIKTAASASDLYAITVSYEEDLEEGLNVPKEFKLWNFNGTAWTEVTAAADKFLYADKKTDFNMFCTNDPKPANRSAYLRSDSTFYKLSGTSLTPTTPAASDNNTVDVKNIKSAVYFKGAIRFLVSPAAVTDGTASTDATTVFWSDNNKVYYSTAADFTKAKNAAGTDDYELNAGTYVSALAYTKNALLIGRADYSGSAYTKGGISKANISSGIPSKVLSDFTTNAASQLASSYQIYTLLCANPEENETEASIYATMGFKGSGSSTSVSYENIGLWSYYKERGNWNRE